MWSLLSSDQLPAPTGWTPRRHQINCPDIFTIVPLRSRIVVTAPLWRRARAQDVVSAPSLVAASLFYGYVSLPAHCRNDMCSPSRLYSGYPYRRLVLFTTHAVVVRSAVTLIPCRVNGTPMANVLNATNASASTKLA